MDDRTASGGEDPDEVEPPDIEPTDAEPTEREATPDGVVDGELIEDGEPGHAEARTEIVDGEVVDPEADAETEDPVEPVPSNMARRRRALVDWIVVIGVALLVAFVVRTFVLAHFVVDGTSMYSTLHDGDRVFVNKLSYRLHDPNRGDVVVLHQITGASERDLIKRVIALPGETIEYRNCQVIINGRLLDEPYLDPEALTPGDCGSDQTALEVPDDHVFVMGDNRGGSQDSRAIGTIDEDELVGRAFVVFWPRADWQWL
ncbi:MAG: signal peptidase I [Ilumatobacteraceae bacterium]